MKWIRFFLILFPTFFYGLHEGGATDVYNLLLSEWEQHSALIEHLKNTENHEESAHFLQQSIECCQRALHHCDTILDDIAKKTKEQKNKPWRVEMRKRCKKDKDNLLTEIKHLQVALSNVLSAFAFEKAHIAQLVKENPPRSLHNVAEVVSSLNQAGNLYEEARALAYEALSHRAEDGAVLRQAIENFQLLTSRCKKEADEWPNSVDSQKEVLQQRLATLREDIGLFEKKGLKISCYELQKQAVSILEKLGDEGDLSKLRQSIVFFETEADQNRLTAIAPTLSPEDLREREELRRAVFFQHDEYTLYTEQFYRFLLQSDLPASHLVMTVSKQGKRLRTEKFSLPLRNTGSVDGMVFIPETNLKRDFGLELRLNFVNDPKYAFALMVAQKGAEPGYQFSFALDEEDPRYSCTLSEPPPWQLSVLCKPAQNVERPIAEPPPFTLSLSHNEASQIPGAIESMQFEALDQLVEECRGNPLLLTEYVYHEIDFVDPFLYQRRFNSEVRHLQVQN